uniref:Uncharacterized protein n=1 Tax=Anopheles albimanus TaxID=7167 RepID=A0A182F481_ANOAL
MRTTQKGDMLIELRQGVAVPTELHSLVEESLGQEAAVRALTQDATIECRNLHSLTTEEELEVLLQEQREMGTRIATIRMHIQGARKLLAKRSIKIRWFVGQFRIAPRVDPSTKQS